MKAKDKTLARFQCRRTLRLTGEEDARLSGQAAIAGISVSEYMRRLFFGGRPLVAKTDGQTIRELRRIRTKQNADCPLGYVLAGKRTAEP